MVWVFVSWITELIHIFHCLPSPVVSPEQEIWNMRTTLCSRRCCQRSRATEWFALAANPYPQRFPGFVPSVIGWVCFRSHTFALWQLVLPSASLFFSIFFFLLHLSLHLSFCTLDFSLLIVLQKNGKCPVGKGSACLISSSNVMEESFPGHAALPYLPRARRISWITSVKYLLNNIIRILQD